MDIEDTVPVVEATQEVVDDPKVTSEATIEGAKKLLENENSDAKTGNPGLQEEIAQQLHSSSDPVSQEEGKEHTTGNNVKEEVVVQDGEFHEDGQEGQSGDPNQEEQQNEDQENWNNYSNQQYGWNGNYQWYPPQGGYYYSGGYGGDGPRRYNDYYYGGSRGGYRGGPPGQPRNNFRRPISPRNSGYGNYRQSQPYHHRYYEDSDDVGGADNGGEGYRQNRGYQFSRYYNSDRGYQNGDWDDKNNYEQEDAENNEVNHIFYLRKTPLQWVYQVQILSLLLLENKNQNQIYQQGLMQKILG